MTKSRQDALRALNLPRLHVAFDGIDDDIEKLAEEKFGADQPAYRTCYFVVETMYWVSEDPQSLVWCVRVMDYSCGCSEQVGEVTISLQEVLEGVDTEAILQKRKEREAELAAEQEAKRTAAQKADAERQEVLASLTPKQRAFLGY